MKKKKNPLAECVLFPAASEWSKLITRPQHSAEDLQSVVQRVFSEIEQHGDTAVRRYTKKFDGADLPIAEVPKALWAKASTELDPSLRKAITQAAKNICTFHEVQREKPRSVETTPGVTCWRESRPIERVGIYIPGGNAPLFSTVLMLGIPASIAGCKEIILCSPPQAGGSIHPAILHAAHKVGVSRVFAVGGIQAIAALTLGTQTIPRVDKLFGPGNQYVTAAKQFAMNYGVAIDMPAGPSEVLIIADDSGHPDYIAADLLAQAEHGPDSQVMLVTTSEELVERVNEELLNQLGNLPRKALAIQALGHSRAIVFKRMEDCIRFSNAYAPEHLILAVKKPLQWTAQIMNAGSVFIGHMSCESAGDYASGTNHTLPTNGYARNYSGVSLDSFVKKITFQRISTRGLNELGPAIIRMAAAEELQAHAEAVRIRMSSGKDKRKIKKDK